jgi:glycolate oxidase FAD binding subunit
MATVLGPAPDTFEAAAATLAAAGAEGRSVRICGAGTKVGWGFPTPHPDVELHTTGLDRIVEHNAGDLTAVLEAGVPLAQAQRRFASANQMLALDPALGGDAAATIGGVIATADSGPLRHRYGAPRDLIVGITVALSDGTIARSGGKVIKNVAGYDLGKLFTGSFGTLGVILSVSVRLHPIPVATATAHGGSVDPELVGAASRMLAAAPLEFESLDVSWHGGRGVILARSGGAEATRRSARAAALLRGAGLEQVDVTIDDADLWDRQRTRQRSPSGALVRVAAAPSRLPAVLRAAAACGGTLVGRAALGSSFVTLEPDAVALLRQRLPAGSRALVLDAPAHTRTEVDPWGSPDGIALDLMRRVKARFDPAGACNPGLFVGGI